MFKFSNQGYYHTKASVVEYIEAAKDYNGKELIDQLKTVLPAKSTVLELGSGPGSDFKILQQTFNVTGSDYSEAFVEHLKTAYPQDEFLHLNAAKLETEKRFDGIYSNKVLHHLSDQELAASIQRQSEILNKNGIVCHSFWKGVGDETFKGLFVNYHSEEEITKAFDRFFETVHLSIYDEFEAGDSILFIGRKK